MEAEVLCNTYLRYMPQSEPQIADEDRLEMRVLRLDVEKGCGDLSK